MGIEKYKYYQDKWTTIYHGDCLEIMSELEPVDLVLTDPPYGLGASQGVGGDNLAKVKRFTDKWDDKLIDYDLLKYGLDLGKYACCWGGNYYPLPPSPSWLIWDKLNTGSFADCELAWTNYGSAARIIRHLWNGMIRKHNEPRFHPTQKPLDVLKWAIQLSPKNNTILDFMMGSGTTLVAAKQLNRKSIGIEIEEKYCEIAVKRLAQEVIEYSKRN